MFCKGLRLSDLGDERVFLTDRVRFGYRELEDNWKHVVDRGDTLWNIAARRYRGAFVRPAGLWWVVADFQPDPIHDPTIELEVGRVLVGPSPRVVRENIFSEQRREEQ